MRDHVVYHYLYPYLYLYLYLNDHEFSPYSVLLLFPYHGHVFDQNLHPVCLYPCLCCHPVYFSRYCNSKKTKNSMAISYLGAPKSDVKYREISTCYHHCAQSCVPSFALPEYQMIINLLH